MWSTCVRISTSTVSRAPRMIGRQAHEAARRVGQQRAALERHTRQGDTTMSFSVQYIGKPDAIKRKLEDESARLTGQSKTEFDAVKPALDTILDQQVGNGVIHLSANGHASFADGVKTYGNCQVEVKVLNAF